MNLPPVLRQRYFDSNGNPLEGGKLYTYQAGTTTPQATYTDSSGSTPNPNPVILDANGEVALWLDPALSYKFILKDSSDVTQWTTDQVIGLLTANSVGSASLQDGSVTTAKIADDAVTADKLKDSASVDGDRAVTTNHLRDSLITPPKLSDESVGRNTVLNLGLTASVAANALTIALKTAAGNDPTPASPVKIPFRSGSPTSGGTSIRSVTAALSATVSAGSTLGLLSGVNQYVYVYAIDNAGTVELAFSSSRHFDEGALQTTTSEGGGGAADTANTLYSTTARSNVPVRLIYRLRSNQAVTGNWASAISEVSAIPFRMPMIRSEVSVSIGNGHGSTNTKVRRFTTTDKTIGTGITYADSATLGATFTISEAATYAITYCDYSATLSSVAGISINSSTLTSSIEAATSFANGKRAAASAGSGFIALAQWTGDLAVGDVVRPHTNGNPDGTDIRTMFTITKVAST